MKRPDLSRLARLGAGWVFLGLCVLQVLLWLDLTISGIHGLETPSAGAGAETSPPVFRHLLRIDAVILVFAGFTVVFGLIWKRQLADWMHLRRRRPAPIDRLRLAPVIRSAATVVLYIAAITVAFRLQLMFSVATNTTPVDVPSRVVPGAGLLLGGDLVDALTAGLWEELVLFALPVALILRNRWSRWPWMLCAAAAAVVIRLGIHLYYGWGSAFVLPWIVAAFAVLWFGGSIWPLVIGHAIYDAAISVANRIPSAEDWVLTGLDIVVLAAVAVLLVWSVKRLNGRKYAGEPRYGA